MATEKSEPRIVHGWSKLEEKRAGSIGPGYEKDPTKGTQNPFTAQLKPAKAPPEEESTGA